MAGSYGHVTTDAGYLGDPEWVNDMLENGGDVYEAVEEMYGMIWWLATEARPHAPVQAVKDAHGAYEDGLKRAREALS